MSLNELHLKSLRDSGLTDEAISARGYRTITDKKDLETLGFGPVQRRVPALLVPMFGPKGESIGCQIKPDDPRTKLSPTQKPRVLKYESPYGQPNVVDVPPAAQKDVDDPSVPLWITEGAKKADSACLHGLCCVDLSGVWNWRHTNPKGGAVEVPFFAEIALKGRRVYVAFDSDSADNDGVWQAMIALGRFLEHKGAEVWYVSIPTGDGRKVGMDDWFTGGGDVDGLVKASSVAPPSRPGTGDVWDEDGPPFDPSDVGNGERIAHLYGDSVRHISDEDRWLHRQGTGVWQRDAPKNPQAVELAKASAKLLSTHANPTFAKWGQESKSAGRITAALAMAQTTPAITVRKTDLDTHDRYLGCPNGVVDLMTGEIVEDATDMLVTRSVTVPYDPEAECPIFENFLSTIMKHDDEMVELLIRAMGYTLSGDTSAQVFFLLYGERARNGKSTLMEVMHQLLGHDLSGPINHRLMADTHEDNARFALSAVEGWRMAFAEEVKGSTKFDVQFLKQFAAGKTMQSEAKGKQQENLRIRAKLWYAVNALPRVEWDNAFASRVIPIPFDQSFYNRGEHPEWQEGDLPQDKNLDDKLKAELPGILNLLVYGAMLYFGGATDDAGDPIPAGLIIPQKVKTTVDVYRKENDPVGNWMDECCHWVPNGVLTKAQMFDHYDAWCMKNRFQRTNAVYFGKLCSVAAEKRGYAVKKADGKAERTVGQPCVRGIGFVPQDIPEGEQIETFESRWS